MLKKFLKSKFCYRVISMLLSILLLSNFGMSIVYAELSRDISDYEDLGKIFKNGLIEVYAMNAETAFFGDDTGNQPKVSRSGYTTTIAFDSYEGYNGDRSEAEFAFLPYTPSNPETLGMGRIPSRIYFKVNETGVYTVDVSTRKGAILYGIHSEANNHDKDPRLAANYNRRTTAYSIITPYLPKTATQVDVVLEKDKVYYLDFINEFNDLILTNGDYADPSDKAKERSILPLTIKITKSTTQSYAATNISANLISLRKEELGYVGYADLEEYNDTSIVKIDLTQNQIDEYKQTR